MRRLIYILSITSFGYLPSSCEDFIDIDAPQGQLNSDLVFNDDLTATAAVLRLYSGLAFDGFSQITYPAALTSDELVIEGQDQYLQFYHNEITSINSLVESSWRYLYSQVYRSNAVIEGLSKSGKLTPSLKNQLIGEAKFIRAFVYFYLTNLFGDVPYTTTTDYQSNESIARSPSTSVYEHIIADLLDAKIRLSDDYSYSNNERVRANKWAATAMLAKVYLFTEDWARAEEQATLVINQSSTFSLNADLNDVFLKNSSESILQVIPDNLYTREGSTLFTTGYAPGTPFLSSQLINAFEEGDNRKDQWVDQASIPDFSWDFPTKYKEGPSNGTGSEYTNIIRLAEIHLIRAEARAMQNKLAGQDGAEFDINKIRNRAGLPNIAVSTQQEYLLAIEQECRVELFTEWGHRWFDLKRTGRASTVLQPIKSGWQDTDVLYPIPFSELQLDPNMTQNPGY